MFGEKGVTELTATMGYYGMLACALNAFEVEPAPDAPRLP
jgi:4-carboxymuconolactone decarboxylase